MSDELSADVPAPPEPGDGTRIKAADLKNLPVIWHPISEGVWDDREVEEDGKKKIRKGGPYVECSVWVLGPGGIDAHSDGVRVSWWRAQAQLKERMGGYLGAKAVEQDDRSVILTPLSAKALELAKSVMDEVRATPAPEAIAEALGGEAIPDDGSEPF